MATSIIPDTNINIDPTLASTMQQPHSMKDKIELDNATRSVADNANVIELLAEQPTVQIERLAVGKVRVRKEIRTKTINLPLTLKQEVLIIDHMPSSQLAAALPDTTLKPQDPNNTIDWDAWVKVDNSQLNPSAKIMVNGQPLEVSTEPMELVISQEFAHVQIQTLLAETVRLTTSTEEHVEQIPVTLRHEELITEHKKFDTPQVLTVEEIPTQVK